jgi:hypothetical protein
VPVGASTVAELFLAGSFLAEPFFDELCFDEPLKYAVSAWPV